MPVKRPGSFTVFAILSIVFACLGLLCDILGLVGQVAGQALAGSQAQGGMDTLALEKELQVRAPAYTAFVWGTAGITFLLHIVLLLAGIGLLQMRSWSRPLCILFAVLTIPLQLGSMIYTIAFINPVMREYMNKQFNQAGKKSVDLPEWAFDLGAVFGALVGMTYAVILLIFALRPAMGRQLASARGEDSFERQGGEDYYDEDYQRRRHELPPMEPPASQPPPEF
jgi:hypothetical protein